MNQVTLSGFVGQDPKIVARESFKVARVSIATKMYRNKEQVSDWHDVEAFGTNAEYFEKFVKKGDFVVISGYLTTTSYTDKSGQERKNYGVKVTSVESNNRGATNTPAQPQAPQRQQQHFDDDIPY